MAASKASNFVRLKYALMGGDDNVPRGGGETYPQKPRVIKRGGPFFNSDIIDAWAVEMAVVKSG